MVFKLRLEKLSFFKQHFCEQQENENGCNVKLKEIRKYIQNMNFPFLSFVVRLFSSLSLNFAIMHFVFQFSLLHYLDTAILYLREIKRAKKKKLLKFGTSTLLTVNIVLKKNRKFSNNMYILYPDPNTSHIESESLHSSS